MILEDHTVIISVSFQSPGMLVPEAFEHTPGIQTASLGTYLKTNLFLFLSALGFYLFLRLLSIDLLWSVPIAKKWCANPNWIHIDTTPFAGLVRNRGVLSGLGFAINSEMFLMSCRGGKSYTLSFRLLCALTSLTTLQLYHFLQIPTHEEHLFYVLSFCKSASIPLTVVALIPYCVRMLLKQRRKKIQ
ncbi:Glucose-6-phosphatase 2 [Saguinus oedipus]|uniref:Glucose-6-phosphatase 2 n=1 Tax=Saguinus oedipus TaxID=9490 RepID=A0ABQ9VI95_SAGOE|nr:Glucose-6-phosphatase 2 [Saguinus oedipus]